MARRILIAYLDAYKPPKNRVGLAEIITLIFNLLDGGFRDDTASSQITFPNCQTKLAVASVRHGDHLVCPQAEILGALWGIGELSLSSELSPLSLFGALSSYLAS